MEFLLIPGGGGLGVAVAWPQVGGGGVVFGLCSIPDGDGLGVAVAWPQAGGEGIAFGFCWIGVGKDVGKDKATVISARCLALVASDCFGSTAGCASLLDEGCIGLECFGSRAGCASLLDVEALAFGRRKKAGVDCVIGVAAGVDVAALLGLEVADCVVVAGLKEKMKASLCSEPLDSQISLAESP